MKTKESELLERAEWYQQQHQKLQLERDEARAEVERLKAELHDTIESYKLNNLQPKTTRPEPSRLEIAAMIYAGVEYVDDDDAFKAADKLIAAAKKGK